MKLSKSITNKKKVLNKDVSKTSKEHAKTKLKVKSAKNKEKEKSDLTKNNKKVKPVKRLKNTEISHPTIAASKKKKILKEGDKNEKKKIVSVYNEKSKEDVQASKQIFEKAKKEIVRVKSNSQKTNLKRKSLSSLKKPKKLKSESESSTKQQKVTNVENVPKNEIIKKEVESKEEDIDICLKDLSRKHILQCISAIFHLTQEQLKNKKSLFSGESQPIFMQVTCIRVPKVPRRQVRITLPHSIVLPDDDIALFVCDVQKGKRKDYEPSVDHYRELLDKCGCTRIKDIIPMNQVKNEYDQYELKRKLVASYDHFLVDGRIAGHLTHILGQIFYKKRKLPTSIKFDKKNLKNEIDIALQKTAMQLHSLADSHIIQVGNTSMKKKHILENVIAVSRSLAKVYPGGWLNIRAIRLKAQKGPGLPIYITCKNKNTVRTPFEKPKRPKAYHNVEGELTTLSGNANVTVTPEGKVIVKQTFSEESEVSEDEEKVEKE